LQVPIIIRYPGQEKKGVQTYAITELIDMFPTLCELAGIKVPDYMQGSSLVPLLNKPDMPWKKAAFSQFHRRPRVSADGGRYMGYSINTEEFHYIEWFTWDHVTGSRGEYVSAELYDRLNDPHESINIAQKEGYSDLIGELSKQLADGWRKAAPNNNRSRK
jgi:iduronate 2-sulfatase